MLVRPTFLPRLALVRKTAPYPSYYVLLLKHLQSPQEGAHLTSGTSKANRGVHAALHVVASQSPATCPLVEYLITKMRSYYFFEKRSLTPVQGKIELSDAPGFGIEFDPARIERREPFKI